MRRGFRSPAHASAIASPCCRRARASSCSSIRASGTCRSGRRGWPTSPCRTRDCGSASTSPRIRRCWRPWPARRRPTSCFPVPMRSRSEQLPRDRAVTLIVLDGTWWQARKLLKLNPAIAALPRVAFHPRQAERLPDSPGARRLLRVDHRGAGGGAEGARAGGRAVRAAARSLSRHGGAAAVVPDRGAARAAIASLAARVSRPGNSLAARLAANWSRLVCVHGEANAWPRHHPARRTSRRRFTGSRTAPRRPRRSRR